MDTIGDFLTRIRNGAAANHEKVDVPNSKMRMGIAEVLQKSSYISNYKVVKDGKQGMMRVYLKYNESGQPAFLKMRRVSRPGLRQYVRADKIPNIRAGYGMAIMSTSKGVMSGGEAKKQNLGGEILCMIW